MPFRVTGLNAERLRELRTQAGLDPAELAHAVGVVRTTVLAWESGSSSPTTARLARLAAVLHVEIDELVDAAGFPDSLASLRAHRGLYQRDVAARLGVSRAMYGMVELKRRGCPPAWLPLLAELLTVSIADIRRLTS